MLEGSLSCLRTCSWPGELEARDREVKWTNHFSKDLEVSVLGEDFKTGGSPGLWSLFVEKVVFNLSIERLRTENRKVIFYLRWLFFLVILLSYRILILNFKFGGRIAIY